MSEAIPCTCSGPGPCPLRGRVITAREHALCAGTCAEVGIDPSWCEPAAVQRRRQRWRDELASRPPPVVQRVRLEWVSAKQLAADSLRLAALLPADLTGIVGVPRSGMVPAALIASVLHLPLYHVTGEGVAMLQPGGRGRHFEPFPDGGRLAVIDDTVYSGRNMRRVRELFDPLPEGLAAVTFAAVYVRPEAKDAVDVQARLLPSPHLLEWNIVNNNPLVGDAHHAGFYRKGIALDLDGIILHDEHSGGAVGSPYLVPRMLPAPLVVTGRAEDVRELTERQLRTAGVQWKRLEMHPEMSGEPIAEFKARIYAASGCGLFLESDPVQAELIHKLSGLPVACPAAGRVWPEEIELEAPREPKQRPKAAIGVRPPPPRTQGPGAHVKGMLTQMGVPACKACHDYAVKMDAWGVEGCKERRGEIIAELEGRARKLGWAKWFAAGARAVLAGLPKTVTGIVDEALRRAEEEAKSTAPG